MTLDEFRLRLESFRFDVDEQNPKNPMARVMALIELYRSFDSQERLFANEVLAEWVLSECEIDRYDALALIREFKIGSVNTALNELRQRLLASTS